MPEYVVMKPHDSRIGVLQIGEKVSYSEALGKELIKKGLIAPFKQPIRKTKAPKELLLQIARKRSLKVLKEMIDSEQRQEVIEAIKKRIKEIE